MNPNLHGWGRRSAAEPSGAGQDRAHGRGAPMKREAGAVLFGGSGDSTGMRRDATSLQHMMWLAEQQHAQQQARMHHVQQIREVGAIFHVLGALGFWRSSAADAMSTLTR